MAETRAKPKELDRLDWAILGALQRDARASRDDLAAVTGLAEAEVAERVRTLEVDGVITAYRAVVDPRKAGYALSALISLSAHPTQPDQIVNEELTLLPEVLSCWSITGTNDYLLEVQVPSLEFLEELLIELARFGRLTTNIVLPSSEKKRVIAPPRFSMTD